MVDTLKSGILRATLEEVEPGLFRADYPCELNQEEAGREAFPDTHIGTDAAGVKSWVEEMAAGLGYERVEWVPSTQAGL
jgi:hypothetical protein